MNKTDALKNELQRCVDLLDGECTRPDGSNADTTEAHALLGHFGQQKEKAKFRAVQFLFIGFCVGMVTGIAILSIFQSFLHTRVLWGP
jgi:hypothetical protein